MLINRQTTQNDKLQLVTAEEAARTLGCNIKQLRYAAWPQEMRVPTVGDGGSAGLETILVTGEAWVKSPNPDGSIGRDDTNLPALVFVLGQVLGVAPDIEVMEELITPEACAWLVQSAQGQLLGQSAVPEEAVA